jgi:hypothetical protein
MTDKWIGILIRFGQQELETINAYCIKHSIKRTDFVRGSIRDKIANADSISGTAQANSIDLVPLIDSINLLSTKVENLEKISVANSGAKEENKISAAKGRITEAIRQVIEKTSGEFTTTEKLGERIKRIDPSLEPFLHACAASGVSPFDEVLIELDQDGMLHRNSSGIIELNGGVGNAQGKKNRLR